MKKLLLMLLLITAGITALSQSVLRFDGLSSFGKTTIVGFPGNPAGAYAEYGTKLHRFTVGRKDFNPAYGVYTWATLDSAISKFAAAGKYLQIEMYSGDVSPQWVFDSCGTFSTTGGNRNGPWPRYMTDKYRNFWYQWNVAFQTHLMSLPYNLRSKIAAVLIDFGSTGDAFAYKGTPTNPAYIISDPTWLTETKRYWDSIVAVCVRIHADTLYSISFNPGNSFYNYKYFYDRYSYLGKIPFYKQGALSHFYNVDGSGIEIGNADTLGFGETQFPIPGNLVHPHKEGRALVWQTIVADFALQINPTWRSDMREAGETITSPRITDPANVYMQTTNRGFSVPSGQLMYEDTVHYPTATYGPLITPASLSAYNSAVASINADTYNDWRSKKMLIYNKIRQYISYRRVDSFLSKFPDARYDTASYTTDPNFHMWDNDIVIDGILNYEKNVKLLDPYGTTVSVRRIGPDTSMWGRGGFKFKITDGAGQVGYSVADSLKVTGNNRVQITVYYLDAGTGTFSINCTKCRNLFKQNITCINTGLIKQYTMAVDKFKFYAGDEKDFWLKYESGDNTSFAGVEFFNSSKP